MHHSFNNWTGQDTDHALEKDSHLLRVLLCFYAASLLGGKQVQLGSNQATCQSGEWEEPEESRRHTQLQKKAQYHEAIIKIYVLGHNSSIFSVPTYFEKIMFCPVFQNVFTTG